MAIPQSEVCLICNDYLNHQLTMKQLILFKPIEFPVICQPCSNKFVLLEEKPTDCYGCGRHLDEDEEDIYLKPHIVSNHPYCLDCLHWLQTIPSEILSHRALFDYNTDVQDWITNYKYKGDVRMAHVVAPYIKAVYRQFKDYLWIILPSSPYSLASRQFHPTAYLLEVAGIPYEVCHDYIGDGIKQAHKNKQERMNLKLTYQVKGDLPPVEKILIFDDIYTTGATMNQAKLTLYQHFQNIN